MLKEKIEQYLTEWFLNDIQEDAVADLKNRLNADDYIVARDSNMKGYVIVTFIRGKDKIGSYKVFEANRKPEKSF